MSPTVLRDAFKVYAPEYRTAIYYSLVIGVLSLSSTIFMLEVYDRVVNSRSVMTLSMLTVAVVGSYIMLELLELVRHGVLSSIAARVDQKLRERLFDITFEAKLRQQGGGSVQVFNDFKTLRDFMSSPAVTAMMDAPMALVFLLIVFILSPWLGVMALIGALVQVWVAINTERSTMPVLTKANRAAIDAQNYANGTLRNAQVIEAMGMMGNVHGKWMDKQRNFLLLQAQASDTAGTNSALSKFIQTMQGSLLLGASCWLTLKGDMLGGGGMMIVASTLGGKVLTPLVQLVAQWRTVVNARDAYQRLEGLLAHFPEKEDGMSLPDPTGLLTVESVVVAPPGSQVPILKGVSFGIQPGECVVLIGPSASGKTTLARVMMGLWPANAGKVRLDGADVFTWNKTELGPHMGYLPQTVELFDGTVAENVARFGDVDRAEVARVIHQVGLDDTVAALPFGLDTRIGEDGAMLSGGQRQRVALARAIYGAPKLLVLDEPNSSLDEAGELALMDTLRQLKAQGATVVLITHRTSVLPAADKVLMLREGTVAAFGPRDEVLAALRNAQTRQNAGAIA
ncbi:MAG: type I secretion system permease/ATPase [Burkholderiales bacterium 35-55-47]|jgi:ATP-binding cassette subfamily C exporter for protease/lipase|nr:MAG: type I secretion system permease/ATPase [Burkholderiales bacterium 35-55-47]OYZ72060.1 MAG: type I secretion system permease/ATPase [Burkholderiales bacterium 24-55-52]OZA99070.1 MAG: type I secretion system permease/ATPase [Burkholderiales bacterium 39-55-53]